MYTEELGYGSIHEVEALEIEIDSPAMRSKKYACFPRCKVLCGIVMWAVFKDMFTWLWVPQSRSSWAPSSFKSDFVLKGIGVAIVIYFK